MLNNWGGTFIDRELAVILTYWPRSFLWEIQMLFTVANVSSYICSCPYRWLIKNVIQLDGLPLVEVMHQYRLSGETFRWTLGYLLAEAKLFSNLSWLQLRMLLNVSGKSNSYKTHTNEKRRTNSYFLFNKRKLLVKINNVSDALKRPPRESFAESG